MAPHNIPQSTIDRITEQIMAKVMPALDDVFARTAATVVAESMSQSTTDKIAEQIIAKVMPALDDVFARNAAAAVVAKSMTAPKVIEGPRIPAPDLRTAHWIWTHETPHHAPPSGARAFRKLVIMPPGELVDSMLVDTFGRYCGHIYVNGCKVGWTTNVAYRYSVKFPLTDRVVIAVSATSDSGSKDPAGLLTSAIMWNSVQYTGRTFATSTDATWETSIPAAQASDFLKVDYEPDSNWTHARVEGPYGMQPWGDVHLPQGTRNVEAPYSFLNVEPFGVPLATQGPLAEHIL